MSVIMAYQGGKAVNKRTRHLLIRLLNFSTQNGHFSSSKNFKKQLREYHKLLEMYIRRRIQECSLSEKGEEN